MNNLETTVVVFDTNSLSARFFDSLSAFVTGRHVPEDKLNVTKIAQESRPALQHTAWYDLHVRLIDYDDDEHSYESPAAPWPTKGRFYDGYGKYHDDTPVVRANLGEPRASSTFSAYESVGIFVTHTPPADVLAEMVARARMYCESNGILYLGCRVLAPRYELRPVCVGHVEVERV